ncbi:ParB/RepB/Spo0J family partition protein [Hydrogenophaga sp. ANAO-22]|uniref:ParB/RepB/Spo0J family partition protein n=1 Tax=Hydrogenophaga sp. ANAO-22 TaxID=3166645 RepID=UPI0036D34984
MAHLARESDAQQENERLRDELRTWDGAVPVRKLDPTQVVPSDWANRHSDSFLGPDFDTLKQEIASAGGNVQPIKVRPISTGKNAGKFEVVYGHRRHRACLDLGLQVAALVESVDDRALFVEMDRENRQRADLRPFEQGEMYRRALSLGLFPSMRKLAEEIGVPVSQVSRAHQIAALPPAVLMAFSSPLDIQFRWGAPLAEAVEKRLPEIERIAAELASARGSGQTFTPQAVFDQLLGNARPVALAPELIKGAKGSHSAKLSRKGGKLLIEFDESALSGKALTQLKAEIARLLG